MAGCSRTSLSTAEIASRLTSFSRSAIAASLKDDRFGSEQLCDALRGAAGAAGFDVAIQDGPLEPVGDRVRQHLGIGLVVVHAGPRAVPPESMRHMDVLLEMVPQREIEERPLRRGQLH